MKKGQVAYFMLVALIILISFGFLYYVHDLSMTPYEPTKKTVFEPVNLYIEECIKNAAAESLLANSFQGGFYNGTPKAIVNSFSNIPIFSDGNTIMVPGLEELEQQLSLSVDNKILRCVKEFKIFENQGFNVNFENPSSNSKIMPDKILFDINLPVTISKGTIKKHFDRFSFYLTSRYKLVYNVAEKISQLNSQNPTMLCLSCIIDYGNKNDLRIIATDYDNKTIRFSIIDQKVKIGSEELVFNFMHKLGGTVA